MDDISPMCYTKPATTHEEQLSILERRGVIIENSESCKQILENINYYRLTAYLLPFKQEDGTYEHGISFFRVYRLYEFDRKLRSTLFSAVEDVEITLRARFAYYHAHKYGPTGYLDASNYNQHHDHDRFRTQIHREIESNNKTPFVKHHLEQYGGVFPIWAISELFTFGMLSRFYADLPTADQKTLSKGIYQNNYNVVRSWLHCCSGLRNICAHYGRLYYRIFPAIPRGFEDETEVLRRLWGAVLALCGLYLDTEKWNYEILGKLMSLFDEYSDDIDLSRIAFPRDWEQRLKK